MVSVTENERRLREAIAYADSHIRNPDTDVALHFWRGWRAFALCELELSLRPAGLGEGGHLGGNGEAGSASTGSAPVPAPSSSPELRIVR